MLFVRPVCHSSPTGLKIGTERTVRFILLNMPLFSPINMFVNLNWTDCFIKFPILSPPPPSDGMRCCRSDWPGLCFCCCYQTLCAVRLFLFHEISNFIPLNIAVIMPILLFTQVAQDRALNVMEVCRAMKEGNGCTDVVAQQMDELGVRGTRIQFFFGQEKYIAFEM